MALTPEAVESAVALAEVFNQRGIALKPVEGTVLAQIVNKSGAELAAASISGQGDVDTIVRPDTQALIYFANRRDEDIGGSEHDLLMDEVTQVGIEAVTSHLNFARTVVAPAVQDLVERVTQSIASITPSSLLGVEVKLFSVPEFVTANIVPLVRTLDELPVISPELKMALPDQTDAELFAHLTVGSTNIDNQINEWILAKGAGFLQDVWWRIFQLKPFADNDQNATNFTGFLNDPVDGFDRAVAIYLLARKLYDNIPEGTEMGLSQYENLMAEFRNQAAAKILRVVAECERAVNLGLLIRSIQGKTVTVYEDVYKAWIEEGGSNEILFGNVLSNNPFYRLSDIKDNASKLLDSWNYYARITAATETDRKTLRIKSALEAQFNGTLMSIEDEPETLANRVNIMRMFQEQLEMTSADELDDLYNVALRLVCRSRFYRTDSEKILRALERNARNNPQLSEREAATLAMVEYVTDWISAMITVQPR